MYLRQSHDQSCQFHRRMTAVSTRKAQRVPSSHSPTDQIFLILLIINTGTLWTLVLPIMTSYSSTSKKKTSGYITPYDNKDTTIVIAQPDTTPSYPFQLAKTVPAAMREHNWPCAWWVKFKSTIEDFGFFRNSAPCRPEAKKDPCGASNMYIAKSSLQYELHGTLVFTWTFNLTTEEVLVARSPA